MAAFLEEVRPDVPALREVILFTEWEDFVASGEPSTPLPDVHPADTAQIQYTSGTTGFPKGAELHHRGLTNNARFYAERIGLAPGDVYVNPMPMFHTAGCGMGVLGSVQSQAVHVPVLAFDPALRPRAARVGAVQRVRRRADDDDRHARTPRPGASRPLRLALRGVGRRPRPRRVGSPGRGASGRPFRIVFGTTECSPLLTQTRLDDTATDRAETLGQPLPQTEVQVADAGHRSTRPGRRRSVSSARAGYLVMNGYHRAPDATAAAIDAEGWYHTGDLASMDDRGYLRIEGRVKDMIIRGGENIYPREIEDVLYTHPGVAEVAVVGVADESWGEVVAAFVRPVSGVAAPTPDELRAYCRERLAPYKTPLHWAFVESFPLTASGKIQKFKLRESFSPPPT